MAKILVTGGAGFIGSNLVDKLLKLNHQLVVIDNLSSGKEEYLNSRAKFYNLNILDDKVQSVFEKEKFDYVYHLAAQIDVRVSVENPRFDNEVNILGSFNILENCSKYKVKKIIFSSSGGAIYGFPNEIPTKEDYPANPVSPYGINKLMFEKYLNYYYQIYDQDYVSLRLANVYGPRQYKGGEAGVVSIFVDKAVNGEPSFINGDGLQTRDFIYVDDVVEAFVSSLDDNISGNCFNIGTGQEKNLLDIISAIESSLNNKLKIEHLKEKKGEERRSCLDSSKAKNILNWEAEVCLDEGIKKTIEWSKNSKI
jgi:UDP-glucose 4-epimerase